MDESKAQGGIPRPPAPRRRGPPGWIALAVFALLVLMVHLELTVRRSDRALLTYDSAEYAIAGRHLAHTGALATWFVHPDELATPRRPPFPLIVGHPLVPLLDAAVFAVGGARPALTLIPAGLCYLALVLGAYALGRRLSDSAAAGLAAGGAVALAPQVLHFASEGLSEIPFAAAWMGALILMWDFPRRPRPGALGLLLGIAHLARPTMGPMLPAWLIGIAWAAAPGTRGRTVTQVLLGFLGGAAPLALYKLVAAGHPLADVARFNLLSHLSPELDPVRIHRMIEPPEPLAYLLAHPEALWGKVAIFGPRMALDAIAQGGWAFAALFLVWALRPGQPANEQPFRFIVIATFVLFTALVTITLPNRRYLFPLLPVLLVVGIGEAARLASRLRAPSAIAVSALPMVLVLAPALSTLRLWSRAWPAGIVDRGGFTEREWITLGRGVAERVPAGAVTASDVGPHVAWYGERASVLIPNSPEEIPELDRRLRLESIVLTNHWLIGQPGSEGWRALYFGGRTLAGWSPIDTIEAGRLKAIIFGRSGEKQPTAARAAAFSGLGVPSPPPSAQRARRAGARPRSPRVTAGRLPARARAPSAHAGDPRHAPTPRRRAGRGAGCG